DLGGVRLTAGACRQLNVFGWDRKSTNCWTDVFVVRLLAHRGPGAACGRASCGNSVGPEQYRANEILAEFLFAWLIWLMGSIYALL
ncbi:hypothetical protein, partial [Collinsella aerofaciens]|uniref:hypothetical protein n=1 Tax=Collinsella aerofaciens TaxID=74426 RepID=UPI00319EB1C0